MAERFLGPSVHFFVSPNLPELRGDLNKVPVPVQGTRPISTLPQVMAHNSGLSSLKISIGGLVTVLAATPDLSLTPRNYMKEGGSTPTSCPLTLTLLLWHTHHIQRTPQLVSRKSLPHQ